MRDRPRGLDLTWHDGLVDSGTRGELTGRRGATVWLTGLSGSGKSTIAAALEHRLLASGTLAYRLDGDNLRHGLCADLGFSPEDREENVRRTAEVATLLADAGMIAIVALISPTRSGRSMVAEIHAKRNIPFHEVHVATDLAECERRDPKGLYAKARRGDLPGFTGIDDPYEAPLNPALRVGERGDVEDAVTAIAALLRV